MAAHGTALPTDGAVEQGLEFDHAAELIGPQTSRDLAEIQALHLACRFRLPPPIARAVAELAFGWRAAA